MRLYLDASTIIHSIESMLPFRDTVIARIAQAEDTPGSIVITSLFLTGDTTLTRCSEIKVEVLEPKNKS